MIRRRTIGIKGIMRILVLIKIATRNNNKKANHKTRRIVKRNIIITIRIITTRRITAVISVII